MHICVRLRHEQAGAVVVGTLMPALRSDRDQERAACVSVSKKHWATDAGGSVSFDLAKPGMLRFDRIPIIENAP